VVATAQAEAFSTPQLKNEPKKVEYLISHQNERRIRLFIPRLGFDEAYAGKLQFIVESLSWVTSARINLAAKSIAVEFNYEVDAARITAVKEEVFTAIEQATYTEIDQLKAAALVEQDFNYWQRLGLPVTALGLAALASPLEVSIPFLVMGVLMAGAAMPIVNRAIAGIVQEGKCKVDVLDSLWVFLQTLQGQYVAPALMLSLLETGEAVRDITARINKQEKLQVLGIEDNQTQAQKQQVTNTQIGNYVQEVSENLIVPTLFLSGGVFALTGNITPALAPLQLDFGTGIEIALPTTILAALTALADSGVLIRDGRTLESLARTDAVIFGDTSASKDTTAVADLKAKGIQVYLSPESVSPDQKIAIINKLHKQGKTVAYVGDDFTDTLAFGCVSVAFAKETYLEKETADVVIVGNDLSKLSSSINIAKQAMDSVYQNIAIVALPNITVAISGIFFGLHPVAAVLINNFAILIAQINGERTLLFDKYKLGEN
jgi:cation transport ATPase